LKVPKNWVVACIQFSSHCIRSQSSEESFASTRQLKAATNFAGQKCMVSSTLKEPGLRAQFLAVKKCTYQQT
jgi:hypothetical protein